jgi:hypothetical protein
MICAVCAVCYRKWERTPGGNEGFETRRLSGRLAHQLESSESAQKVWRLSPFSLFMTYPQLGMSSRLFINVKILEHVVGHPGNSPPSNSWPGRRGRGRIHVTACARALTENRATRKSSVQFKLILQKRLQELLQDSNRDRTSASPRQIQRDAPRALVTQ